MKTYLSIRPMDPRSRALADEQFGPDGWVFEQFIPLEGETEEHGRARFQEREKELGEGFIHLYGLQTIMDRSDGRFRYIVTPTHFGGAKRGDFPGIEYVLPIQGGERLAREIGPGLHTVFGLAFQAQRRMDPARVHPDIDAAMREVFAWIREEHQANYIEAGAIK